MKLNKNNEILSFLYIWYGFRLGVILSGRREMAGCHGCTIIGRIRCNVTVSFLRVYRKLELSRVNVYRENCSESCHRQHIQKSLKSLMRSNFQIITNNPGAIFVTDRNSSLLDIGSGLCVYPCKKLRGSANKDEYSKIKILDLFPIIFDNKLWEILVTGTNHFAYQTMHDERKRRKMDDAWYPITLDEIFKGLLCTVYVTPRGLL